MKIYAKGFFVLVITQVLFSGCAKRGPDPSTIKMLQSTSDQALMTVVLRQDRWQQATQTISALAKLDPSGQLAKMANSKDLLTALSVLFERKPGMDGKQKSFHLTGLDTKKSIVASLFQPVSSDVAIAARSMLPPTMEQINASGIPGIRHTVILGATNVPSLMKDLQDLLLFGLGFEEMKKQQDKTSKPVFLQWKQGRSFLVLIPEENRVRIEIVQDELLPQAGKDRRISNLFDGMLKPHPKSKSKFNSPAWRLALGGKHLVAIHLRPWVLRDLSSQVGTSKIVNAISYADPAERAMLLAMGMSEVANGYLHMSRQGAEIEDVAMGVDLEGGLRVTYLEALSEYGKKLYTAGESKTPFDLMPSSNKAIWTAWNRADLATIFDSAKTLDAFSNAKNISQAMQAIKEGGFFVYLYYLLTSPVGIARTLIQLMPIDISRKIPKGFALSFSNFNPKVPGGDIKLSAALGFDSGSDTSWIHDSIQAMGLGQRVQFSTDSEKEGLVVRIGMGMDAKQEFSLSHGRYGNNELAGARVDLPSLLGIQPSNTTHPLVTFTQFDNLRAKIWMKDRALVAEALLPLAKKQQEPSSKMNWSDLASYGGSDWSSLAPSGKKTKGQACMELVTRGMIQAFKALAYADPGERGLLLAKAISELNQPIQCAIGQADTKEQAEKTRTMLLLYAADRMEESHDRQAALDLLSKGCKQGIKDACVHAEKLASKPEVHPAKMPADTQPPAKDGIVDALGSLQGEGLAEKDSAGLGLAGSGKENQKQAVLGSLPKEVIRRVIRRHNKAFTYCYEKELTRDPKLSGKVVVKFTIDKKGSVLNARVQESTMNNKSLESCLLNSTVRLKFPEPEGGGVVVVQYPFIFKAK